MIKKFSLVLVVVFLASCKSAKKVVSSDVDKSFTTKKIIQNHYQNELDFTTLSGRLKINYDDGENSQSLGVSLRMKKDEAIWISGPSPLSIVKAIITPERVSFYNKLENEYFDGDFSYLSKLLGTELDFEKVQNVLLGNAILDLREDKYASNITEGNYELSPKRQNDLFAILFSLEPTNFKIATQELSQSIEKRLLKMNYQYQTIDTKILPATINIEATSKEDKTLIKLDYRGMEFGKRLNFPYKIPKGFKEIVLE